MQGREVYFAPNPVRPKRKESSEIGESGYLTKHTSGDKGNNTDDSDVYQLKNTNTKIKNSKQRNDDTITQESEEVKQKKKKEPMTFKSYRMQILEKKKQKKKLTRERQKEIVRQKNSSNGSIKNDSDVERNNQSMERSVNTSKLINRITEINDKKKREKSEPAKLKATESDSNQINLDVNYILKQKNEEVSQEQIKINLRTRSPKPPKPKLKKGGDESINSLSNSINISQLIKDTKPQESNLSKKKFVMESKPKSEQRKLDALKDKQPLKIDVKNIKFKKNGKIPIVKLKKLIPQYVVHWYFYNYLNNIDLIN